MTLKKILKYLLMFIPAIIIIVLLLYFSDLSKVKDTILTIPPWAYVIILIISALSWLLRGERWRVFLKLNDVDIRLIPASALAVFGNFANWVVPARIGDLAWAYLAKKVLKTGFHITLITIVLNRLLDFLSLVILLQISFFFIGKEILADWAMLVNIVSIAILLLFLIALKIFLTEKWVLKIAVGPLKKIRKYYSIIKKSLLASTNNKRIFLLWTLLSIIIWLMESSMAYVLFFSIGIRINYFFILLAVIMGNITKVFGITPGGVGTYEAAMALTIVTLTGLNYSVVLTLCILDHFLKKFIILIVGAISTNYYGIKLFNLYERNKE